MTSGTDQATHASHWDTRRPMGTPHQSAVMPPRSTAFPVALTGISARTLYSGTCQYCLPQHAAL